MSTALRERPAYAGKASGGMAARRAVIRWAWRLFRREWRQQFLVLALITVAVAVTIVGSAVAINIPPSTNSGFGTAGDMATFTGTSPHLAAQIASLEHRFGRVDVIENQTQRVPGSISPTSSAPRTPAASTAGPCSRSSRAATRWRRTK
jgi:putative ABC transport system permease protein